MDTLSSADFPKNISTNNLTHFTFSFGFNGAIFVNILIPYENYLIDIKII